MLWEALEQGIVTIVRVRHLDLSFGQNLLTSCSLATADFLVESFYFTLFGCWDRRIRSSEGGY